ncbi:hypothetical protein GMRT_10969 [Giardia muris]|uniref:Uncharacterized protein n=1 Tax=Giardia muris TaxID=5742 RepID=A0A4Z1SU08_GIAMU|nr:hypothetical protein GMRT_10969 [Giardia muris]|eukprot:TNJ29344.1 hypothetical protein GMRT_10969 [Giardia muris]
MSQPQVVRQLSSATPGKIIVVKEQAPRPLRSNSSLGERRAPSASAGRRKQGSVKSAHAKGTRPKKTRRTGTPKRARVPEQSGQPGQRTPDRARDNSFKDMLLRALVARMHTDGPFLSAMSRSATPSGPPIPGYFGTAQAEDELVKKLKRAVIDTLHEEGFAGREASPRPVAASQTREFGVETERLPIRDDYERQLEDLLGETNIPGTTVDDYQEPVKSGRTRSPSWAEKSESVPVITQVAVDHLERLPHNIQPRTVKRRDGEEKEEEDRSFVSQELHNAIEITSELARILPQRGHGSGVARAVASLNATINTLYHAYRGEAQDPREQREATKDLRETREPRETTTGAAARLEDALFDYPEVPERVIQEIERAVAGYARRHPGLTEAQEREIFAREIDRYIVEEARRRPDDVALALTSSSIASSRVEALTGPVRPPTNPWAGHRPGVEPTEPSMTLPEPSEVLYQDQVTVPVPLPAPVTTTAPSRSSSTDPTQMSLADYTHIPVPAIEKVRPTVSASDSVDYGVQRTNFDREAQQQSLKVSPPPARSYAEMGDTADFEYGDGLSASAEGVAPRRRSSPGDYHFDDLGADQLRARQEPSGLTEHSELDLGAFFQGGGGGGGRPHFDGVSAQELEDESSDVAHYRRAAARTYSETAPFFERRADLGLGQPVVPLVLEAPGRDLDEQLDEQLDFVDDAESDSESDMEAELEPKPDDISVPSGPDSATPRASHEGKAKPDTEAARISEIAETVETGELYPNGQGERDSISTSMSVTASTPPVLPSEEEEKEEREVVVKEETQVQAQAQVQAQTQAQTPGAAVASPDGRSPSLSPESARLIQQAEELEPEPRQPLLYEPDPNYTDEELGCYVDLFCCFLKNPNHPDVSLERLVDTDGGSRLSPLFDCCVAALKDVGLRLVSLLNRVEITGCDALKEDYEDNRGFYRFQLVSRLATVSPLLLDEQFKASLAEALAVNEAELRQRIHRYLREAVSTQPSYTAAVTAGVRQAERLFFCEEDAATLTGQLADGVLDSLLREVASEFL